MVGLRFNIVFNINVNTLKKKSCIVNVNTLWDKCQMCQVMIYGSVTFRLMNLVSNSMLVRLFVKSTFH